MSSSASKSAPRARDSWSGQTGFLLAAIGSAIGLGNIWRFPGVSYSNGGGAFLVPYLVALIFVGIPMLWLDYAVGHKFRGSPPWALRKIIGGGEFRDDLLYGLLPAGRPRRHALLGSRLVGDDSPRTRVGSRPLRDRTRPIQGRGGG